MTAHVALLTTGRCESLGLPRALAHALGPHADVRFEALGEYHSFTSALLDVEQLSQVGATAASDLKGPIDKLAEALVSEAVYGRWDLVVAVDDLELVNAGNASGVRAFFRDAVVRTMRDKGFTPAQRTRVAKRASFHLLSPMVEAYFFGERAAVQRACVSAGLEGAPPWPQRTWPVEEFHVDDPVYVDRTHAPDLPKKDRLKKTLAWRAVNRERHPKHYMEFLCRASERGYQESRGGVAALEKLDFHEVLSAGAPLLAELLEDIQDALQIVSRVMPACGPLSGRVLRNIA